MAAAKRIFVYNSFGEYGKVVCVRALREERPECRNIFSRRRLGEAFPPKLQQSFQKKPLESVTQCHDTMTYPCFVYFHEGLLGSKNRRIFSLKINILSPPQRIPALVPVEPLPPQPSKSFFCGAKVFSNLSNGFFFAPARWEGEVGGISFER